MDPNQDLDAIRKQHSALAHDMPHAWNAFFASFGQLRPVQLEAMPSILAGRNVLVMAPTAGGKTEAVIAPISERLARHRWPGLSVLVITPTRALVNDLFARLQRPLDQMRIRLGRKTADHGLGVTVDEQVLVTTPESVESLLTFRRDVLDNLNVIVLDEIHLLDGTARGDQLRCILGRLSAYRHYIGGPNFAGLQTIAMSATVSDSRRLANVYLGGASEVIQVSGHRDIVSHVLLAASTDKERAEAAINAVNLFPDVHKVLAFVNSRKQVDCGASFFRCGRFERSPIYGHHGSLSKAQREETEARFKAEAEGICVATMTLEVGIDIGDIDLVICMDPPFSLASFLQRIGRGCRRMRGCTRVLCVARDRAGELMFHALVRQAAIGMPPVPTAPFRRSVLVQQMLAYLKQVGPRWRTKGEPTHQRVDEQFVRVFASEHAPPVSEMYVREVLSDLVQSAFIRKTGIIYEPDSLGWEFIESNKIFGNIQPNPLEVALVDVESGKVVATAAGVRHTSGGVLIAGRSYDILPGKSRFIQRVRSGGMHDDSPNYWTRSLPYSSEIGASLANFFGFQSHELPLVRVGQSIVILTWLGRLINAVLAHGLVERGYEVSDGSFHLTIKLDDENVLLPLIREVVEDVIAHNPFASIGIEHMVDLGPHIKCLSPTLTRKSQEDWLDSEFLRRWCSLVCETRIFSADSEMGVDLLALT